MYIVIQLKLSVMQVSHDLDKRQRHIRLLPCMVRVGLVEQKQKLHTISSLIRSTQVYASWHKKLATEVLTTGKIKIPSGREFAFPDVQRRRNGSVTFFTQIKNYPVQSFATADIVPISLLYIDQVLADKLYAKLCSKYSA